MEEQNFKDLIGFRFRKASTHNDVIMNGIGGRTDWESFLSVPDIQSLAAELELDLSVVEANNELLRSADLEVELLFFRNIF